jgi:SAM-dependent methyltransferase
VLFFPEGTRRDAGEPMRFRKGAFELAVRLNADILPVVLCDTWTCLPRRGIWVERFRMRMRALPRITPQDFDYSRGARTLARHAATLMSQAWEQELEHNNTVGVLRRKVARYYRYHGALTRLSLLRELGHGDTFLALHRALPRTGLIVIAGCGYGTAAHWLLQASPRRRVLGLDGDAEKLRVAGATAREIPNITFQLQESTALSVPDCDAVFLADASSPTSSLHSRATLEAIRDAVNPGGRLVVRIRRAGETTRVVAETAAQLEELGFSNVEVPDTGHRNDGLVVADV